MVKKFTIPFASQGDANDIPDALQVDGKVSFTQGFGYDYERPYDDPQAKDIAREDMNGLFKAITSAVGELQTLGASEWSSTVSYPKGAIVYFEKDLYISQVDGNQNEPPQNWVSITSIANDSLKKAANLSDLTDKVAARNNLGLGSSATLNKTDVLGTSSNLVATQKLVNDTKVNLSNDINALQRLIFDAVPVGVVKAYVGETAPNDKWLLCRGQAFSAESYPDLAQILPDLKIPDLRGVALRGLDANRGFDPSRKLLSYQEDAMQKITASGRFRAVESGEHASVFTHGDGAFKRVFKGGTTASSVAQAAAGTGDVRGDLLSFDSSLVARSNTQNETTMKNVAVNFIIKAR